MQKKLCEKWYFLEKGADCILLLVFSSKTLDRPQLLFSNSHWTFEDSQGTLTTRIVEEMDPFFYSLSLTHARTHTHFYGHSRTQTQLLAWTHTKMVKDKGSRVAKRILSSFHAVCAKKLAGVIVS